jgi:hypothetical protein
MIAIAKLTLDEPPRRHWQEWYPVKSCLCRPREHSNQGTGARRQRNSLTTGSQLLGFSDCLCYADADW